MIKTSIAAVLAVTFLAIAAGCATRLAEIPFEEHLAGEPPRIFTVVYGTVESVRPGAEIVVRLQDGTTIAVVPDGSQRFAPGQRVRVVSGAEGARVERT